MTGFPLVGVPLFAATLGLALPVPACHYTQSLTVMLCGGPAPVKVTIPIGNAPVMPALPDFAKACHACRHEDDGPELT